MDRKLREKMKRRLKAFLAQKIEGVTGMSAALTKDGSAWEVDLRVDYPLTDDLNPIGEDLDPAREALALQKFAAIRDTAAALGGTVEWQTLPRKDEGYSFTYCLVPDHMCIPDIYEHDAKGDWVKVRDARQLTDAEIDQLVNEAIQKNPKGMWALMLQADREALHYYRFVGGSEYTDECWDATRYAGLALFLTLTLPVNVAEPSAA